MIKPVTSLEEAYLGPLCTIKSLACFCKYCTNLQMKGGAETGGFGNIYIKGINPAMVII